MPFNWRGWIGLHRIPARFLVVAGPGHEIYVDEPEECISAFLKFLKGLW